MSTETNTQMFDKFYEQGIENGYLKALSALIDFISPNKTYTAQEILKWVEKEMAGKK